LRKVFKLHYARILYLVGLVLVIYISLQTGYMFSLVMSPVITIGLCKLGDLSDALIADA
jgi:hypothetical protein